MRHWHALASDEALRELSVDAGRGLSADEARARLEEHGPNQLREAARQPWWRVLLAQFQSMVVYLLGAAAVLAFATQRWPEGGAVLAVIVVNTGIGFVSEWKAVRSMAALRELGEHRTRVRRDGTEQEIDAPDIVPGDIVVLDAGDLVPADLRLIEGERVRVNEAPLTGESVPVEKTLEAIAESAPLGDRNNMLYKGTSVADGTAAGVAVATGPSTELGRISELAESAEASVAPLQQRLDQLGRRLAWLTIGIAAVVGGVGYLVRRQEAALVVETALALGIAAIPEGLPIVATIALARGMYRMAQRNALVNQLTAVETLGATRVIFTDKTGTLTENRMRLDKIATCNSTLTLDADGNGIEDDDALARRVVEVGVLCNSATLEAGETGGTGDPTEVALLAAGRALGLERETLLEDMPEVRVEEFDFQERKMATFHERDDRIYVAVKGGPGAVLEICTEIACGDGDAQPLDDEQREEWRARADELAGEGLRLLAMAEKHAVSAEHEPYADLRFLGLVGLLDPPRKNVKESIDRCQAAGMSVAMLTGDQPETARAIARAVGIVGEADDPEAVIMLGKDLKDPEDLTEEERDHILRANIFARVSPEQKLNLVRVYQDRGEIVAMTGDGVNDAPALKKADIGIAMGKRGTDAAKQVADMVLQDDAFETIVAAVEQGRVIFANIRKAVVFMLTTNVAEVLAVAVATVAGLTLPLHPLQILYLNVLTDVFPALALGVGPASGHEMDEPPRNPKESVLTRNQWIEIVGLAVVIAVCVLAAMLAAQHALGLNDDAAVTVSFLTIAFGKLWFTFSLRHAQSGLFDNEITRNRWVWGALGLCTLLLIAAVYLPGLNDLLKTVNPGWNGWALLLGMSVIPVVAGQIARSMEARRNAA